MKVELLKPDVATISCIELVPGDVVREQNYTIVFLFAKEDNYPGALVELVSGRAFKFGYGPYTQSARFVRVHGKFVEEKAPVRLTYQIVYGCNPRDKTRLLLYEGTSESAAKQAYEDATAGCKFESVDWEKT